MEFSDLVGKTIKAAYHLKHYSDEGYLYLQFEDGTDCVIISGCDDPEDESPTWITIVDSMDREGFIPVEPDTDYEAIPLPPPSSPISLGRQHPDPLPPDYSFYYTPQEVDPPPSDYNDYYLPIGEDESGQPPDQ